MQNFTHEETLTILEQSLAANQSGDHDEAVRLIQQFPLAPHLAKAAKEIWGKDYLLDSGFDLSEAEVAYGKDWLDK